MNSGRRTVAAILAALMVGATVPTVCASADDLLSPTRSGTIAASDSRSTAEFATAPGPDRLVSVKPIARRGPSSISLPDLTDGTVQRSIVVRRFAPIATTDAVDRDPIRGRAPPA